MQEADEIGNEDNGNILTPYGEFVLLLDADPSTLREPLNDCQPEQLRRIIDCMEDQINETPLEGNEKLIQRHLLVWMMCIRQLDSGEAGMANEDSFSLNFREWEAEQFH